VACYVWGILALYTFGGGDHFRSFRFFQPTVPLLAVAVGLASCRIGRSALEATSSRVPMIGALALLLLFVSMSHLTPFVMNRGDIAHEFRMAEAGRQIGNTLNTLSWSPSVGVIRAGGVARTYHGQLYDLLGLNWKRMAHAVGNLSGTVRNHGGFDSTVFFEVTPDIVAPTIGRCAVGGGYPNDFDQIVLKNVFVDARFVRLYAPACFRGLIFFVKRDRLAATAELTQPR
jgi:arabinofuranosyltransferase